MRSVLCYKIKGHYFSMDISQPPSSTTNEHYPCPITIINSTSNDEGLQQKMTMVQQCQAMSERYHRMFADVPTLFSSELLSLRYHIESPEATRQVSENSTRHQTQSNQPWRELMTPIPVTNKPITCRHHSTIPRN